MMDSEYAIQLATAAGYDVITTCSKRNFDYVKGLGAVQAFDYHDGQVTEKLAAFLDQGECAGIFMVAGLKEGNDAACKVAAAAEQSVCLLFYLIPRTFVRPHPTPYREKS